MPICETCGSKNADGVKYCSECGKPTNVEAPTVEEKVSEPKKDLLKNKVVLFGGGGVLAAILVVVLVLVLIPFSLDSKKAQEKLMTTGDFAFSVAYPDEPVSAVDSKYPIYRASDKCVEDVQMQSLIEDEGTLLATADFKENSQKSSSVHFDEDIIEFKDEATATKFVALAKAGYDDPDCEYTNRLEYVSTVGALSEASDVQSKFGVGGSNSFYVRYESVMTVTGSYNFTISTDARIAVVARGKYVGIFRGTIDADTKSVSPEDMEAALKLAISKMFG